MTAAAAPVTTHPFAGRARFAAATVVILGGLFQLLEFVFESPKGDNTARAAYWAAHTGRVAASKSFGLLAVPLLIAGLAVTLWLCRQSTPRLTWAAAGFLTMAMVGLAAVQGAEIISFGLARGGDQPAAAKALEGNDIGGPGVVLFLLFLGGAAFGTVCLAVATWKSPYVPRIVPVLTIAFAVIDFAVGWGRVSHAVALVGDCILAAAIVTRYTRPSGRSVSAFIPLPRSATADARVEVPQG